MRTTALHVLRMVVLTALIGLCMVYPFLPGGYDALAVALSAMAQVFGIVGLLLVPIGVLWFLYELWQVRRRKRNLPTKGGFVFVLAAVVVASLVVVAIAFVGAANAGLSIGLLTIGLWIYIVSRLRSTVWALRKTGREQFNFAPLYLIFMPIAVLILQIGLAAPVTMMSRNQAIAMSTAMIEDIEGYQAANGDYPPSLLAVWEDYSPSVVGISQFHYTPNDEAYDLAFEQPRFLLDDIGVKEFVVYNRLDQQRMISHDSWILLLRPAVVDRQQGWFNRRNAAQAHWKYFWFD